MKYLNKKNNKLNFNVLFKRIIYFKYIVLFFSLILIFKLIFIQLMNYDTYYNKSNNNFIKTTNIIPKRGIIFDRNGLILAKNIVYYKIKINKYPNFYNDLNNIKNILNLSKDDIYNILKKFKNNNFNCIVIDKKFKEHEIIKFLHNKFFYPNIKIKKEYNRYYPFNKVLSHSIGYISKIDKNDIIFLKKKKIINEYSCINNIGKIGIEKKYENKLKGNIGFKEIILNNVNKKIGINKIIYPKNGNDIYTSIDAKLSEYIVKLIKNSKSSVIVTNVNNGEILSLISNPSYDPNIFCNKLSKIEYNKIINNKDFPMLNRSTQGKYSPASTIKPYILLCALQDKFINKNFIIYDSGLWKIPKLHKIYKDWKKSYRGWINIYNSIEESSDTFFYNLSYQLGINNIFKYMNNFGFNNKSGIDINEEYYSFLPNYKWKLKKFFKKWNIGDTIPIGIGQGYWLSTPIQMSKALMILINNGFIKTPHLLKYIYDFEKNSYIYFNENKNNKINFKINNYNWNIVKKCMNKVASNKNGTAYKYFINSKYNIAAKTGTAQLFSINFDKEYENKYLNIPKNLVDNKLMIAYAPYENPKYSIVIILENGGDNVNIGNIVKKIFDYLLINN